MRRVIGWASDTPGMFSASFGNCWTGLKQHMVVEALPDGGWDWVAWASDGDRSCMHGTAPTRAAAMLAAEEAARLLHLAPVVPIGILQADSLH